MEPSFDDSEYPCRRATRLTPLPSGPGPDLPTFHSSGIYGAGADYGPNALTPDAIPLSLFSNPL